MFIPVYSHTHTHTGWGGAASGCCCKCVIRGESRKRRIEDTHSPLLRSLCYAVHSGLQGQLSLCKTWQNSSLGRERERERQREGMSIRSNKEHFLHSSAWHHLSTLAHAEWMLRTKHPSGEEENAFGFVSMLMTWASRKRACTQRRAHTRVHTHTHTHKHTHTRYKDTEKEEVMAKGVAPSLILK